MPPDVRLVVQMKGPAGPDDDVRLEDFLRFLFDLLSTLHATDRAVAHTDQPTMDYQVRDLRHSSPATVILAARVREPEIDLRDRVLSSFVGGVNRILAGDTPEGFGPHLLLSYRGLARHLNGKNLREASFKHRRLKAKVSTSFQQKIEQIVGRDRRERGAVSGKLDIVNAHQARPFFWLYPAGAPERIKCFFPPNLTSKVGEAIRRHVTVTGLLRFKAAMFQPYAVNVADIDIHEQDVDLPSLRDLRGIAAGAPLDEPAEDFVRRLRDAW